MTVLMDIKSLCDDGNGQRGRYAYDPPMPLAVKRAPAKLGADIKAARLRRRITTVLMAERAFVARSTLQKVEQGDAAVSLGVYATVLFILGLSERIADLADASSDSLVLQLDEDRLPQRVRASKRSNQQGIARQP
jgi:transcriptional regulator with XRE-family HTH domain